VLRHIPGARLPFGKPGPANQGPMNQSGAMNQPASGEQPATPRVGEQPATPRVGEQPATPHVGEQPATPYVGEQPVTPYVLVELGTPRPNAGLRAMLEAVLEQALADELVLDAAIAESEAQRAAIWRLREEHSEAQKREGASVKNDVSVPISRVPEFIRRATDACAALLPGIRAVPFGHMGDGNIHFNLEQPVGTDPAWFLAQDHAIMDTVNEVVRALEGSFSAEHGIGRLKPYMMPDWRGGAELAIMHRIKDALDPLGIMNPGKVLP